nr:winged helix-turn-helix transcriptional regulator [Desulfobulbaceae bacterium]
MKPFIRVMKALSDPNRIKIVKMLEKKELCVCEITALLGLAQSTVSKHLKLLEDAGLVNSEKNGLWVNYRLADGSEGSPYAGTLLKNMKGWLNDEAVVRDLALQLVHVDRARICAA